MYAAEAEAAAQVSDSSTADSGQQRRDIAVADGVTAKSAKQRNRARDRALKSSQQRLLKAERAENGGASQLTKACGGVLVYVPAQGKATAAATSKVDMPFTHKGGLKSLMQLAEEQGWASDGSRIDPS